MQALYVVPAKVKAAEVCLGEIEALYGAVLEISRPLEEYSIKGGLILKSGVAKFDISIELRILEAGVACESRLPEVGIAAESRLLEVGIAAEMSPPRSRHSR